MASNRPLRTGDVCVIVNSNVQINNGRLVVIAAIKQDMRNHRGKAVPYLVCCVDGQTLPNTTHADTGEPSWYKAKYGWCSGYNLRRVDPKADDAHDRTITDKAVKHVEKARVPVPGDLMVCARHHGGNRHAFSMPVTRQLLAASATSSGYRTPSRWSFRHGGSAPWMQRATL